MSCLLVCPESNGEAEASVKQVKHAIAHTRSEKPMAIQASIHNINLAQRLNMSGCAAELFQKRSVRIEGLATIPNHLKEVDLEKRKRSESRDKEVSQSKRRRRKKEVFNKNDLVSVQNSETGEWTIPGEVVGRCDHNGISSSSYLIRNKRTGRLISRSEKHIRLWKPSPSDDPPLPTPPDNTHNPPNIPHNPHSSPPKPTGPDSGG